MIIDNYLEYNTVTNVNMVGNHNDTLPAITICLDNMFSFGKIVNFHKSYKEIYENFRNFTEKTRFSEYDDKLEENRRIFVAQYQQVLKQVSKYLYKNNNYKSIIENYSLEFKKFRSYQDKNSTYLKPIRFHLSSEGQQLTYLSKNIINSDNNDLILPPIESLSIEGEYKCFTFMSWLQQPYTMIKTDKRIAIKIEIEIPDHWFPFYNSTQIEYSIHSNRNLPGFEQYHHCEYIRIGTSSHIYYSKIENYLLADYKMCKEYDINNNRGDHKMKIDCVMDCLINKIPGNRSHCKLHFFGKTKFYIRNELFEKHNIKPCKMKYYEWAHDYCEMKCKDGCYQAYYILDTKQIDSDDRTRFVLQIEPKPFPNIVIQHLPETTLLSAISNFGGLLGMWLGLSVVTSVNHIVLSLKIIFNKFYSIVNNQNIMTTIIILKPRLNLVL